MIKNILFWFLLTFRKSGPLFLKALETNSCYIVQSQSIYIIDLFPLLYRKTYVKNRLRWRSIDIER